MSTAAALNQTVRPVALPTSTAAVAMRSSPYGMITGDIKNAVAAGVGTYALGYATGTFTGSTFVPLAGPMSTLAVVSLAAGLTSLVEQPIMNAVPKGSMPIAGGVTVGDAVTRGGVPILATRLMGGNTARSVGGGLKEGAVVYAGSTAGIYAAKKFMG